MLKYTKKTGIEVYLHIAIMNGASGQGNVGWPSTGDFVGYINMTMIMGQYCIFFFIL